ncbi:fibrinogen-like protein A [Mercenaria mercenaria]|uniref:fibrinogen-like protein A n=1 Tax=Mercenaria mercenaria TaxID=6596 RepID=UPI00234EA314|nr:fibrinogen-like protein A [Mercenaria mercenaria]
MGCGLAIGMEEARKALLPSPPARRLKDNAVSFGLALLSRPQPPRGVVTVSYEKLLLRYHNQKYRNKKSLPCSQVFQYRFNGSVDFARNFSDYENGFGSLLGEFWLGLKTVQEIVAQGRTELRLDLTASGGKQAYEVFDNFRLGNAPDYTLHIDRGVGTAGDTVGSGLSYHNGMKFYTYDHDNTYSCAHNHGGGFWFNNCAVVNLNGQFVKSGDKGVIYYDFNSVKTLASTKMMMRRFTD